MFRPQHRTPPPLDSAQLCSRPPATARMPTSRPKTNPGVGRSVVELSPSWPLPLLPQHFASPPEDSAQLTATLAWTVPVETIATPLDKPDTSTGVELVVVVPSPSWPTLFLPQHFTPPDLVSAQLCSSPTEIAAMPDESPTTSAGVMWMAFVPSPSSPKLL